MQHLDVDEADHAQAKNQQPAVLGFTGLSGAGNRPLLIAQEETPCAGNYTYLLGADKVRHGLNRDLSFTDADRVENIIHRVAGVARLEADVGLIALLAFNSPFRSERQLARDLLEEGEFIEVELLFFMCLETGVLTVSIVMKYKRIQVHICLS